MRASQETLFVFDLLRRWSERDSCTVECRGADWERVVAFASAHLVLPAIGDAAGAIDCTDPEYQAFAKFAHAMTDANSKRNCELRVALASIAQKLNTSGVVPVVLKGGAFLLEDGKRFACWRFMSDLDLLVDERELNACVAVLSQSGYRPVREHYDPTREAHYPPLASPCGNFVVELHTRLFARDTHLVPTGMVYHDSEEFGFSEQDLNARVLVPSCEHRMAHVLAHAQLHNRQFVQRRIVLKDLTDIDHLSRVTANTTLDWDVVARLFEPDERDAALALVEAWARVFSTLAPIDTNAMQRQWAGDALARLHHTGWRAAIDVVTDTVRTELYRSAREPRHLQHRFDQLLRPRKVASSASAFSYKMRQRLWGCRNIAG